MEVKLCFNYSVLVVVLQFLFSIQQISSAFDEELIKSTCIADHKSYCYKIGAKVILNTLAQIYLVFPEAENEKSFVDSEYLKWPKKNNNVTYIIKIQENLHHELYYTRNISSDESSSELEETDYDQANFEKVMKLYTNAESNKIFKYIQNMNSLLDGFSCKGSLFIYNTKELYQLKNERLLAMTDKESYFRKFLTDGDSTNANTSCTESEKEDDLRSATSNICQTESSTKEEDNKISVSKRFIPEDKQHLLNVDSSSASWSNKKSEMKPGPSSIWEGLIHDQKSQKLHLNTIAGFSSSFELYVEFEPAVVRVTNEVFHARKELEMKLQQFAYNYKRKNLSIVDVIAEKHDPEFGKVIYLMKQVISESYTIVFIIPQYASIRPYENTKPLCENFCTQKEWIFESQLTVCCDPVKEKDLMKMSILSMNTDLKFDPLPVYVQGGEVRLKMNVGSMSGRSRDNHYYHFCNKEVTAQIRGEIRLVTILQLVSKDTLCSNPITDVQITYGTSMRGIIIDLSPELNPPLNRTNELEYNSNSSNEPWNFYSGKQIFTNEPSLWFIRLSEFPTIPTLESIYWTYMMVPKSIFSQLKNRTPDKIKFPLPGPIECTFIGESNLSNNVVFSKENVTKQFIQAIGNIEPGQINIYLEHLWKTKYVRAVPYISYENMTFPCKQSFTSCKLLPIWTGIYEKHREAIIDVINKTVNRIPAKTEVLIHEFQYKLLRFKNSNNPFHLHQSETHPEENVSFYRYLIKAVITAESQIAFVTINDPFLLSNEVKSPFKDDDFISTFCVLKCKEELKYDTLTIDEKKINFCCEVTDGLLETLTMKSHMLTEYLKNKPENRKKIMHKLPSKKLLMNTLT